MPPALPLLRLSAATAAAAAPRAAARRSVAAFAGPSGRGLPAVDLSGRTFLVTGSTDGIGQHTAERLAAAGATVLVHGRSQQRVAAAAARVQKAAAAAGAGGGAGADGRVGSYVADLASLEDVRALAAAVRRDNPGGIDTLINNAGVYSERLVKSADGFELTYAVNVLAPFLLTALLVDKVTHQVITTSSISASSHLDEANLQQERGYSAHGAYSASKLCNQIFTLRLARALSEAGSPLVTNTLDPGTVNTKMLLAGWGRIGIEASRTLLEAAPPVLVRDADNTFRLAADPGPGGESGRYYISGSRSRPVSAATDPALQDRMWALWEQQAGCKFKL